VRRGLTNHATAQQTVIALGLAVASGFSRAMGGDLTIEDTPGGGATGVVTPCTPFASSG
jgi:two-component system sensor histidine kinase KdpD